MLASCENRPGVYRMLGADGSVVYVGTSRALRTRLLSYFRARGRGDRQAGILRQAFDLRWEYAPDAFGALLEELRLIKALRPRLNVERMEDEWPRAYVALTEGPVPGLRIVRRTDDARAAGLFGPFRALVRLADAVRTLAEVAGVRDCGIDDRGEGGGPPKLFFAGSPSGLPAAKGRPRTPGCLRFELGSCPGPCVGGGSADAYRDAMATVRAFLEGESSAPLQRARRNMRAAAAGLAYERAAAWRDRADRLSWLRGRLRSFQASMDRLTFRYRVPGPDGTAQLYLLRRGTVRASVPEPGTPAARSALEALARRIYLAADPRGRDVPAHDLEEFYVVSGWFRRHPGELARTLPALPAPGPAGRAAG